MIRAFLIAGLSAITIAATPALAGSEAARPASVVPQNIDFSAPEGSASRQTPCQCRFNGQYFQQGDQVCIRGQMAQCGMYLNNTSWKFSKIPCPIARADSPYRLQ